MYVIKDGAIRISVRNLVEFVYNSGDIDNRAPEYTGRYRRSPVRIMLPRFLLR